MNAGGCDAVGRLAGMSVLVIELFISFFFHVLCAAVGLPATDEAALLRLGLVAGADPVAFTRRHLRHLGMGGGEEEGGGG